MRNRVISESSEEEYEPRRKPSSRGRPKGKVSQSQRSSPGPEESSSQSQFQSQNNLSESELQRLTCLCANFFLAANCKKVPIKRGDVGKLIPKEYSKRVGDIITNASRKLEQVFGYRAVELEKKGIFILINVLDMSAIYKDLPFQIPPHESAIVTLRTNILIVILMSEGVVQDSTLDEFVRHFGIDVDCKESHPLLGNVQKLIYQDFVRQGYLEVTHHRDAEIPFKDIRWGPRARVEIDQREVIKRVCKVYGDSVSPEMWVEQWKIANEEAALANIVVIDTEDESRDEIVVNLASTSK